MTEQLLHAAQVGTAFEQMGRGCVPQPVWAEIRRVGNGAKSPMHDLAGRPDTQPPTADSDE
jgi:hypothetical protein